MSKTLSVKVKTTVLITALKKALEERTQRYESNDKKVAEYEKAHSKWEADVKKAVVSAVKTGKAKVTEVHTRCWQPKHDKTAKVISLDIEVPKSLIDGEPEAPETYAHWEYRADREALENAIRVLEMSDQEVVSTSTYHSVVKYL